MASVRKRSPTWLEREAYHHPHGNVDGVRLGPSSLAVANFATEPYVAMALDEPSLPGTPRGERALT